ncbi:PCI superfamily domain-containing protein [Histoplasma ohiense]|nr:PCI superfamily domain-containing protein [Histoplasma ohiense (nom. inval.)]
MEDTLRPSKPTPRGNKTAADSLSQVGFTSKGDTKLLDPKAQEQYYKKIVDRYVHFCNVHSGNLDAAFSSLPRNRSEDPTKNPPVPIPIRPASRARSRSRSPKPPIKPAAPTAATKSTVPSEQHPTPAEELSILLLSLRKLREAILATSSKTPIAFSQRVHIFCIRVSILAQHPPSYYPPLQRLLKHLHSSTNPLDPSELHEFTTYLILDYACRQDDMSAAYQLRARAKAVFGYRNNSVDSILRGIMHDDWVLFWRTKRNQNAYTKALLNWVVDSVRRRALKAVGRAYLSVDVNYLVECCAGENEGWTWEALVEKEGLGWKREGDKVLIRARKPNVESKK